MEWCGSSLVTFSPRGPCGPGGPGLSTVEKECTLKALFTIICFVWLT